MSNCADALITGTENVFFKADEMYEDGNGIDGFEDKETDPFEGKTPFP